MRFVSLLITLLIVGWLILQQMGGSAATKTANNQALQEEAKAKAVQDQVNKVYQAQAASLNRTESGQGEPQGQGQGQ